MANRRERPYTLVCVMAMLVLTLACGAGGPDNEPLGRQDPIPTPDRSHVQVINDETPAGLTDADAISAYQQGYAHMRAAAWFSAIAAYDEAIRIEPAVSSLYEARGTAYMYAGRHDQALADYSSAIALNPNDSDHWRRRAHSHTIAPAPETERGIEDATRAIELAPDHSMGYALRAVAYPAYRCQNGATPSPTWTGTSNCSRGTTPKRTGCAH